LLGAAGAVGAVGAATVLATGAVGTATVLAACGSGSAGDGNAGDDGPAAANPGTTTAATTGSGATPTATPGSTATVLGPSSDIPVGGGKVFAEHEVVVTQPAAGTFKAFTAMCTHMQCLVNRVANGQIICPCHDSRYSIKDGSVIYGPAPASLAAKPIKVSKGEITLA
jgi:nitrite reductase/ring-hydroxylating ferredoxin subunit